MTNNSFFSNHDGANDLSTRTIVNSPDDLILADLINQWIDEHSYSMIMIWNDDGQLKYVSKSIESILNLKQESLLGKHWTKVFVDTSKHMDLIKTANNCGKFKSFRVTMEDKDKN